VEPADLPDYLDALADRIDPATRAAANGMAQAYDKGLKTDELVRTTGHPSAPGSPPALESGRLRDSLRITQAADAGLYRWRSAVNPNTVYAHIQEYGGDIWAKHTYVDRRTGITRPGFLRWSGPGGVHFARHVHLPKRPYMSAGTRRMAADGTLRNGAVRSFNAEMGFS